MNPRDKAFKIPGDQIRRLIPNMGGCFASDRITVDGAPVGYMYREQPDRDVDCGWRFFAGDESPEYADTPDNLGICLFPACTALVPLARADGSLNGDLLPRRDGAESMALITFGVWKVGDR